MRIPCPFCGERDLSEFTYLGDANCRRPHPDVGDTQTEFLKAVYFRDNLAGPHLEFWYHTNGCRCWLRVARDTRTHEISTVDLASGLVS